MNLGDQLALNRENDIILIEINGDRRKIGAPMPKLINVSSCVNGNRAYRGWINDSTCIKHLPDVVVFSEPSIRAHQPHIACGTKTSAILNVIFSHITGRSTRLTIWLRSVHIDTMDCHILGVHVALFGDKLLKTRNVHDMKFCITQILRVHRERRNRQQCQHHAQHHERRQYSLFHFAIFLLTV